MLALIGSLIFSCITIWFAVLATAFAEGIGCGVIMSYVLASISLAFVILSITKIVRATR